MSKSNGGKIKFRILVQLGMRHRASRMAVMGILRYASTHPELMCEIMDEHNANSVLGGIGGMRPDGVITDGNRKVQPHLQGIRAIVGLHTTLQPQPGRCSGTVNCDDAAIGRAAASLLIRRNLRHFGFVESAKVTIWEKERGAAFAAAIRDGGFEPPLSFADAGVADRAVDRRRLRAWLESLPKPCGIFATFDARAKHVIDACRESGIAIPELVQVVGVDNEEYICEQTLPSLSSIEPDFEEGGHKAAKMLHAMLLSPRRNGGSATYGIRGIVERQSTRDDTGTARIVNLALDYIRLHATHGATAAGAARAAGCSPRLLQRHFRQALGRTIVQEIRRVRLENVCRMLRRTETPIGEIGPLCGYSDETYLKVIFRRAFGMSMREYRKR